MNETRKSNNAAGRGNQNSTKKPITAAYNQWLERGCPAGDALTGWPEVENKELPRSPQRKARKHWRFTPPVYNKSEPTGRSGN
jgi:hypothetical protein